MNFLSTVSRILALFRRNLTVFTHNRTAWLFAAAAPIILGILFPVFYNARITQLILELIPGMSSADTHAVCVAWAYSSVAIMSAFTSTAAVLVVFLSDRHTDRMDLHKVSGTRWSELAVGYILTAVVVSFVTSLLVVVIGQLWALMVGQPVLTFVLWARVLGGILLAALFFTALNALAITFVTSQGTFGAHSFTMGAVTGFLTFTFAFPRGLGALRVLPFAESASLIRDPMLTSTLSNLSPVTSGNVQYALGAIVRIGNVTWSPWLVAVTLILWSVLLLGAAFWRMSVVFEDK
ncbi:MAG: hypothetical protein FWF43_06235 [Propionibacteriaceae bacterium]|nr:hypothetical protein [Propionibacteriaceae bacterium]